MEDEKGNIAFTLIAHAGTAKSSAFEAMDCAMDGDYAAAEEKIAEGRAEMLKAHDVHFGLIKKEANGEHVEVDILLIHALDHLTMAIMSLDFAERLVAVAKQKNDVEKGVDAG